MELLRHTGNLIRAISLFQRQLKAQGYKVTPAHTKDVAAGIPFIDISDREQFFVLLRANLAASQGEFLRFETLFDQFWGPTPEPAAKIGTQDNEALPGGEPSGSVEVMPADGVAADDEEYDIICASLEEGRRDKDFSDLSESELAEVQALVFRLARKFSERVSRRRKIAQAGSQIDLRRSIHRSRKYGGELVELSYKKKKPKREPIHLLLDVSGSMDVYGFFFLVFMFGLAKCLPEARSYLFSTHLTPVSNYLRENQFQEVWRSLQHEQVNWSGGTNIGASLEQFYNDHLGRQSAAQGVLIMVSDGWDRGSPRKLNEVMQLVRQRVRTIFWLNPLMSADNFQPTCQGMSISLPYLDHLLPFHNLKTLKEVCRAVESYEQGSRGGGAP